MVGLHADIEGLAIDLDALVTALELFEHRVHLRVIGAVVGHHDFEILVGLLTEQGQRLAQPVRSLVGREAYANEWVPTIGHRL